MAVVFSKHAEEQMLRRGITRNVVMDTILQPDEILDTDAPAIVIYQSLMREKEQVFLLRVFVNRAVQPNRIVTLYKTTKIAKYYAG
jgi:hypothetical protein